MKEIKFRQAIFKDGKFHQWHYWGFCGYRREFVAPIISNLSSSGYEIKPSEQFTTLKDKEGKGKEIYEGDVIKIEYYRPNYIVVFENGCFRLVCESKRIKTNPLYVFILHSYLKIKVIGNTHENPEMI